ncbi:hypothetical protein ACXO1P_06705 [Lactobacillus delbrueckii subsp. bulgaricus]|nr:hypothetical protein [Lactobacillus delbrueckii]MDA3796763.1 hypothetical protein [Lactobacillus delbrueckii]
MPSITNPFFAELVAAIEDKLEADGYKMLLCDAGQDSDKERRYLRMLEAQPGRRDHRGFAQPGD